ncbi:uncharacterized protein LOC118434886 [Folsomia candida]|uniref:Interferon-induced very large GTPase 1 n=1 Tax=Folsomia candida TaxID=158441 RepID=A0A226EMA7_FOLCA|nr:uncharacterized protein LOC118434886 [Folsomia candida]XP_035705328.1 uncharacterized protein LOC118434886 [Folsomia candida]XP_035705329.1 uncharacterized protein LOC118434886 [Folsomia candida]OXA58772.1 Interferon-induced very large GTPase 1 [Folsomia candida]
MKEFVEEDIIILPSIEDGPAWIGDLWNCQDSSHVGSKLFSSLGQMDIHPLGDYEYDLTHIKSTKDRIKSLNVEGSLSLELLSGMIKVEGNAKYDFKDESNSLEEELVCRYSVRTFRVEANSNAVIDEHVRDKILRGEIKATHVVKQVQLGAHISANLRIRDRSSNVNTTADGNLAGKLVYGPVSAAVKVKLGFLDSEGGKDFEKNITISSRPQPNSPSQPQDVKTMFEIIESFNTTVSNTFHPTFQKDKMYNGIPIRFLLLPISHFVEVKLEMLYLKIKDDLTDSLEHMFVTLKDITSPNFIRKQLLYKVPALKRLLQDVENKLNREVRAKENQLLVEGKQFFKVATECLQSYKIHKKSAQDLITLGNEFSEKFGATIIQEILQNFIIEGNAELCGAANPTRECQIQIHTSLAAQQNWFQTKSLPVKLLFSSSRNCKNASDLAQLYSIIGLLNGIEIDVSVSLPTVGDDGPTTTPKILIKTISDPEEFEDVGHVVRVLSLMVDQVSEVEKRFFTGYCATRGISFPLSKHAKDIVGLVTILKQVKGIRIANNYIQLRECLLKSETKYSFIITMEGWNYFDCVAAYNLLAVWLAEDTSVNLIVGSFQLRGLHKETPLAFLFKGETLLAVADDTLELKILVDGIKKKNLEGTLKEFRPAREYSINEQRHNFQVEIANLFRNQGTAESLINYKFKQVFALDPAKEFKLATNYLSGCLIVQLNNMSLALASLLQLLKMKDPSLQMSREVEAEVLKADPTELNLMQHYPQILTVLNTVNPFHSAVNIAIQSIKNNNKPQNNERVSAIKESILLITNHLSCPSEVKEQLNNASEADPNLNDDTMAFIHSILEKCIAQNEENRPNSRILSAVFGIINSVSSTTNPGVDRKLQNICLGYFMDTFMPELISKLNSSIVTKFENNLEHHRYYEVLSDLMHLSCGNLSLYEIRILMNDTFTLEAKQLKHFLDIVLNLNLSQQQFIFKKSSVKYLLKEVLNSDTCMELLQTKLCSKSVPDFLPDFLKEKLTPIQIGGDEDLVQIPDKVVTVKELFELSQQLLHQESIPSDYVRLVLNSLGENKEFQAALMISSDEYGYSEEQKVFNRPFTKDTLKFALASMREYLEDKTKTAENIQPLENHRIILVNPTANHSFNYVIEQNPQRSSLPLPDAPNVPPATNGSHFLLGSHPPIDHKRFLKVQKLLQQPRFSRNDKCEAITCQILPYILQKLKMWGVFVLEDGLLDQMLPNCQKILPTYSGGKKFLKAGDVSKLNEPGPPAIQQQKSDWDSTTISKLDIFSSLVHLCDPLVLQDIVRTLTFFPVALPFIMPQLNFSLDEEPSNRGFTSLKFILQEGSIKWETKSGSMVQNKLFVDPYKMIVAIRIGTSSGRESGKSTILNQLFNQRDIFASKSNAGSAHGPPKCLAGSAELIALTKETCSPRLFKWKNGIDVEKPQHSIASHYSSSELAEAILLVNLHGNAAKLPDHVNYFKQYASAFLVFFTDAAFPKTQDEFDQISEMWDGIQFYTVIIDPSDENIESSDGIVYTSDLVNDSSLDGVRNCLMECINLKRMEQRNINKRQKSLGKIEPIAHISTELSNRLINILETTSCGVVRGLLKLQTRGRNAYGKHKDVGSLLESCGNGSRKLIQIVNILVGILTLSLCQRKLAFAHLDRGTSTLSANQTKKQKSHLFKLLQQRCSTVSLNVTQTLLQENSILEQKIRQVYQEIENNSLGLEHFYRELGKLYELAQSHPKELNNSRLISLPRFYGELVVEGHAIELLDGDNGHFHGVWFDQICHSICKINPKIRIFVISIIGLQSSGKSTLLNALFACKFAVSVGRCTRGLFMRLLFLEDDLKEEYGVDAILLVDTEGLGAPEKMNDPDCERKDRQLATFAMSISDLTLVNVIGESVRDLTEILQIVIVTMARLDEAEMTPDILMVQHLTERDATKTLRGSEEFCNAIKEAIDLTEKKDMDIGIRNSKSLTKLLHRVQNGSHLKQFRPFKNGSTVNAPPSTEYHEDVVELYSIILESVKAKATQDRHREFCKWHNLIGSYWEAVEEQDFTLRFKNIAAINEFIDRGVKIAKVKQAAEKTFYCHAEKHKVMFSAKIKELEDTSRMELWGVEKENLMNIVKIDLRSIPSSCGSINSSQPCDHCSTLLTLRNELYKEVENQPCAPDTKATILKFIIKTREGIIQQLDQEANARKIRSGKFSELDQIIQRCLSGSGDGGYSKQKVEIVLQAVKQEASSMLKVVPVKTRIIDEIRSYYENDTAVLQGLKGGHIRFKEFREIEAIDPKWYQKLKNAVLGCDGILSLHLIDELEATLGNLPVQILKERKEEIFQNGMTWSLRLKVNEILNAFEEHRLEKKKLNSNFKWEAHLFALNKYLFEMEKREKLWKRDNDPLHILENNISTYREMIKVRLENGYGSEAEGKILCKLLFEAIRKRAQQFADNHQIAFVQSQSWLSNGQRVRLKYFAGLAREVNEENKERALQHFMNPKAAISHWFKTKLNSFTKEKSIQAFKDTITTELATVRQSLENSANYLTMKSFADSYLNVANEMVYKPKQTPEQVDFVQLKTSLLKAFMDPDKRQDLEADIAIVDLSEVQSLQNLMGCTFHCPLCSGVCWGASGHENDSGDQAKHHTCHQPMGFARCSNKFTRVLLHGSCDKERAKNSWEHNEERITWGKLIDLPEHKNWIYEGHSKKEFDDMMKWFFVSLHEDIAARSEGKFEPANIPHDFLRYDFNTILSTIQAKIGLE